MVVTVACEMKLDEAKVLSGRLFETSYSYNITLDYGV
jgi:hypothetical protein